MSEPNQFSCGTWVLDVNISKETFYEMLLEEGDFLFDSYTSENISKEEFIENIKEDWVHFHINGADEDFGNKPAWYLGSQGIRGAKR